MQFIKSIFCWQGFDNRVRFISINFLSFISFIIINETFIQTALVSVIALLILSIICLTTTQRRLRDAQLHRNWLLAPTSTFLISGLIIIFVGHGSIYWLLLVPLLLSLLLLTYPSSKPLQYILGYFGPVDLSEYQENKANSNTGKRIEPTMNATYSANEYHQSLHSDASADNLAATKAQIITNNLAQTPTSTGDLGESIRLALFSNRNAQVTLSVIAVLLVLAISMSLIFAEPTKVVETQQRDVATIEGNADALQHRITLSDNFDLLVSTHNGIVINWQADATEQEQLWDITSAIGDKSCQSIAFNKGETIRSYMVNVENEDEYYAYFSPLDTKALIKNLAIKGKFSLCGYEFSLKGSQAVLGKTAFYANLL